MWLANDDTKPAVTKKASISGALVDRRTSDSTDEILEKYMYAPDPMLYSAIELNKMWPNV